MDIGLYFPNIEASPYLKTGVILPCSKQSENTPNEKLLKTNVDNSRNQIAYAFQHFNSEGIFKLFGFFKSFNELRAPIR